MWDARLFSSRGRERSKPQFLTTVQSLKLFRLTQVDVLMVYQLFNFVNVCWKHYSASQQSETLSAMNAIESFSIIHILALAYLAIAYFESIDHVPLNIPNRSHSTQSYIFEDNAAAIQMINEGRSQNLRHVTRTHRVDLDSLCERVNVDHSILFQKMCEQATSWRIFWQREGSPRCNGILCRLCGKSQWRLQLFSQAFLLLSFRKSPSNVSGDDTSRECWPGVGINTPQRFWNQAAFRVTLEQLSNCEFYCAQDKKDLLAGMHFLRGTLAGWYFISDLEKSTGLWDKLPPRRRTVGNARGRSSRLLRFCFM